MSDYRVEHDTMGEVRLPAAAYYGPQTQRAVENFTISGQTFPPELIHALALVKWAAAIANRDLGKLAGSGKHPLDARQVEALIAACREVADGTVRRPVPRGRLPDRLRHVQQYERQRGDCQSGHRTRGGDRFAAEKPIHANDHVNMGQSTNDVFPTAIHVAVARPIREQLLPALHLCGSELAEKAAGVAGRAQNRPHAFDRRHPAGARPGVRRHGPATGPRRRPGRPGPGRPLELPIGGTAVGSGINTHPEFARRVCQTARQGNRTAARRGRRSFRGQRPARRRWSNATGNCGASPPRCLTWPTTSAG